VRFTFEVAVVLALHTAVAHAELRTTSDVGVEIGVAYSTYPKLSLGLEWFGKHAYLEARIASGARAGIRMFEERVGAGIRWQPAKRIEITNGWRIGHTRVSRIIERYYWTDLLAVELVVARISVELRPQWTLQVVPCAPTIYWHGVMLVSLATEVGVGYVF